MSGAEDKLRHVGVHAYAKCKPLLQGGRKSDLNTKDISSHVTWYE